MTKGIHRKEGSGHRFFFGVKYEYKYDRFSARQSSPFRNGSYSFQLLLYVHPRFHRRFQVRFSALRSHRLLVLDRDRR